MSTSCSIKRHINDLGPGAMFTTRDLLVYGTRTAVDMTTWRMVRDGWIIRLARGVFCKADIKGPLYTGAQIAVAKAVAFGKKIMTHGAILAARFGIQAKPHREVYSVDGRSTSFQYYGGRIYLEANCPRRLKLGKGTGGDVLRALWQLTIQDITEEAAAKPRRNLDKFQRQEIQDLLTLVPWWLNHHVNQPERSSPLYKKQIYEQRLRLLQQKFPFQENATKGDPNRGS